MTKLSWTGFSKKTPQERKEHLKTNALLSQENQDFLDKDQQLTLETANQMAENVIGRFTLPFAICPDVLVDGVTYQVPMVTELWLLLPTLASSLSVLVVSRLQSMTVK